MAGLSCRKRNQVGREREIILDYGIWKTHFSSDKNVIGREVTIDGRNFTVVGVMGPRFHKPSYARVWVPLAWTDKERVIRGEHSLTVIARLKPGVSIQQAQADMTSISRQLEEQFPTDDKGWGAVVVPLHEQEVGDVRKSLLVLLGAVAFVLLIACANVTNLVLAKTLARRKEVAIRVALGASRRRLLQEILSETVLLSLIGGLLGIGLAKFGTALTLQFLGDNLSKNVEVRLDATVLLFTFFASIATGLLAGIVPAWRLVNTGAHEALKQGSGRTTSDTGSRRTRGALVISEVALSLMLLVGAGLMIRTLWALRGVNPGFDPQGVLKVDVPIPRTRYNSAAQQTTAMNDLMQQVRTLPGVQSAAAIDTLPLTGGGSMQPVAVEGRPVQAMADQPEVAVRVVTPGYPQSMHIPLLRGRDVSEADTADAPGAVLISESMAKQFWPDGDAIGKHLTLTFFPKRPRTIVGVVGDVKDDGLAEQARATLYTPLSQVDIPEGLDTYNSVPFTLVLRTSVTPTSLVSAVTRTVHDWDASAPVQRVMTMDTVIEESVSSQRFTMMLLAAFAGLAVLLAAVGIYSVLAYEVRRRVREIGIRMALGAQIRDVLRMIITDGMRPTLAGVIIGLVGSLALGRVMSHFVYGVSTQDVTTLVSVSFMLIAIGVAASIVPAYRAARVEPVQTLREE